MGVRGICGRLVGDRPPRAHVGGPRPSAEDWLGMEKDDRDVSKMMLRVYATSSLTLISAYRRFSTCQCDLYRGIYKISCSCMDFINIVAIKYHGFSCVCSS